METKQYVIALVCACVLAIATPRCSSLSRQRSSTKTAAITIPAMHSATRNFKVDWCRHRMSRYDFKAKLRSCWDRMAWEGRVEPHYYDTDAGFSYVNLFIKPAGFYSKAVIHSVTSERRKKAFGGDFYRVYVEGPTSVTATVIDQHDGSYEAMFLIMVPGFYTITVILDYTMCRGVKDPPMDWFKQGCLHGSFQPPGSLHDRIYDYINTTLATANGLEFEVKPSYALYNRELDSFKDAGHLGCRDTCNVLWDGYGVWNEETWEPYTPGLAITNSGHIQGRGVLWVYGDSLNRYFFESISARRLCLQIFQRCYFTMTWVYILRSTAPVEMDLRYGHKYINIPKILNELKSVIQRPEMQDENSALLLNTGVHLLKSSSFYTYQKVINGMVEVLKEFYRGTVIWKTTTSIGEQKQLYSGCFRRFHTEQRVDLFNAYAMAAMCRAGFVVLDVYPLTSSYPSGTVDGVHYNKTVFKSAEDILEEYFST